VALALTKSYLMVNAKATQELQKPLPKSLTLKITATFTKRETLNIPCGLVLRDETTR
jgi:hypothetical protein